MAVIKEVDMTDSDRARLALENVILALDREQPNVQLALSEAQKAFQLLGGKFRG